jgi:hypothetical protein
MTINAADVRALSTSPEPGGVPLPPTEVDRIAAVLNYANSTHTPEAKPTGNTSPSGPDTPAP